MRIDLWCTLFLFSVCACTSLTCWEQVYKWLQKKEAYEEVEDAQRCYVSRLHIERPLWKQRRIARMCTH